MVRGKLPLDIKAMSRLFIRLGLWRTGERGTGGEVWGRRKLAPGPLLGSVDL